MSNQQKTLLGAEEKSLCEVLPDILKDICTHKKCTLLFTIFLSFIISLIPLSVLCKTIECNTCFMSDLVRELSTANLTIMGFDIAALALLLSLFNEKTLNSAAKNAFNEQFISFIGNAVFQLFTFLLALFYPLVESSWICSYLIVFLQLWALILVFDIIIEIYTFKTTIKN